MNAFQAYADSIPTSHIIILIVVVAFTANRAVHWAHGRGWYWQTAAVILLIVAVLVWFITEGAS